MKAIVARAYDARPTEGNAVSKLPLETASPAPEALRCGPVAEHSACE